MKTPFTMGDLEPPSQRSVQLGGRVARRGFAARCPAMEGF
jgi:hypothetical protein